MYPRIEKGLQVENLPYNNQLPSVPKGSTVLGFGKKTLSHLQELGKVPKNRTITSCRCKVFEHEDVTYLFTYDTFICQREYDKISDIQWDVKLAQRIERTGQFMPEMGNYRYVQDFSDTIQAIEEKYAKTGKPVPIVLDLETMGLIPYYPDKDILIVTLTHSAGQSDLISVPDSEPGFIDQLRWIMQTDKVALRGANLKFDLSWIKEKWGIDCHNFNFDTGLAGSLLDENRSNSLNVLAKLYTPIGGYDDPFNQNFDKSRMETVPKEDMLIYAGGDTDACYQVADALIPHIKKDKALMRFYKNLLHPATEAFLRVEERGMLVDVSKYDELEIRAIKEKEELTKRAFDMLPLRISAKHKDNFSLTRKIITKEFLFTKAGLNLKPEMVTEKTGEPSTTKEHLEMFSEHPEAGDYIKMLREYSSVEKTLSTYIRGFKSHIRPDGKFHPNYFLSRAISGGTVTGRTSAKSPAFQTIPKHTKWSKPLREVFVPPPGHAILNVDFSQGELRVAACIANENTMINAYREGIDLHSITAAKMLEMDFEDFMAMPPHERSEARFGGKAGNFGMLYGMGAEGFVNYAWTAYKVGITVDKARKFREGFFSLYPNLTKWHSDSIRMAKSKGYVRSPLGRIRHLPLVNSPDREIAAKSARQSINSPVQATLSDLTMLALIHIDREYPDLWCFGMTHDSLSFYVPEDKYMEWARILVGIFENLPLQKLFGWTPQLTFTADAEVGFETMADLQEIKL